ncbi:hypothetical protein H5410_022318 [Solanum commersonii]|uniref:Uncharacterized protein n=1 Tax=Solanum commersonii TaxID=4109 RepID=A0A9J5ZF37_SOLCO|nr:hypothetical protein H5410_022318 [Solanum commersonii]
MKGRMQITQGVLTNNINSVNTRKDLWASLAHIANQHYQAWLIDGDFNVVLSWEEKLGRLPVFFQEMKDFANCLTEYGLFDLGYSGSIYTWWNERTYEACIIKRLDRVLSNQQFLNKFLSIQDEEFQNIVRENWVADFEGNPFLIFHHKIKKLKGDLTKWSKEVYRNIFQRLDTLEEVIQDEDKNTKFFHAYMYGRRKRLHLHKIQNSQGE